MIFYAIFVFIFGLAIGSFLNVLIDRLPQGKSIMGRSHCDFCHKKLAWYDLVPVFSFIVLRGRCRNCKKKLSFFYPVVELLTAVIFTIIFLSFHPTIGGSLDAFYLLGMTIKLTLAASLIVIFFADIKYQIIPDSMQILFFLSALVLNLMSSQIGINIVAAIIVMLPILMLFLLTKGKGMGFGDVKYAFSMGFLLGIKGGLIAIYIAFILGALVGVFLLATKKKKLKSKIAFGPFLILGTVAVLKWSTVVFDWFRAIYGV